MADQEAADLTTFHESDLPPEEGLEDREPEHHHPPRNAVVEGAEAPAEEAQEEEPEEDIFEDSIDIPIFNDFGDEQPTAVSIRGPKDAVERVKQERMLHADYTRKTTELARQRDGIAEAVRQAQEQGRTQYVQQLESLKGTVLAAVEPELRNVDWQKLAAEDPQEFLRLHARSQQLQSHLNVIEQQQRSTADTQSREDYARLQERIRESRETVAQWIPGWSDHRYSSVLQTVSGRYGFTLEEVGQVIDPRIIRLMDDVTKFHQGSDKRAIVKKRIAETPKVIPAGAAPKPREADSRLEARFRRTGSIADGARLLEQRLGSVKR